MRIKLAVLLFLASSMTFVACGDDDGDSGGTDTGTIVDDVGNTDGGGDEDTATLPPIAAEVCDAYATAICAQIDTCAPLFADIGFGRSRCIERTTGGCLDSLSLPGVVLANVDMEACVSGLNAMTCDDFAGGLEIEACRVVGELADGAACLDNAQCQSGGCYIPEDQDCGTCTTRAMAAGESCAESECPHIMHCGEDDLCVAPVVDGEVCSLDDDCMPGHYCVVEAEGDAEGTCAAPAAEGEDCNGDGIGAPNCDFISGFWCHAIDNVCAPIGVSALGERCGFDLTEGLSLCSGSFCETAEGEYTGTCTAFKADGEACREGECEVDSECIGDVCTAVTTPVCE